MNAVSGSSDVPVVEENSSALVRRDSYVNLHEIKVKAVEESGQIMVEEGTTDKVGLGQGALRGAETHAQVIICRKNRGFAIFLRLRFGKQQMGRCRK